MVEYFINFFVWYYRIVVYRFFRDSVGLRFAFYLNKTNALTNAQNFGKPLFQDNSSLGKFLGYVIRLWWIASGSTVSFFLILPRVIIFVILFVLPLLLPLQIINVLYSQL